MNDDALLRFLRKAAEDDARTSDEDLAALLVPMPSARKDAIVASIVAAAPRPRHHRALAPALLAAALVTLYVAVRPLPDKPLPSYTIAFVTQARAERSVAPASSSVHLQRDARFELVARPASRSHAPLACKAYLVRDGVVTPWAPPTEVDPGGSIRMVGAARAWFPGAGDYELLLAIGPREMLPTDGDGPALYRGKAMSSVRVLREHVVVHDAE